jgi:hypothetical protein
MIVLSLFMQVEQAARECEDDACSTDLSVQQVSETWRFLSQKKIL